MLFKHTTYLAMLLPPAGPGELVVADDAWGVATNWAVDIVDDLEERGKGTTLDPNPPLKSPPPGKPPPPVALPEIFLWIPVVSRPPLATPLLPTFS